MSGRKHTPAPPQPSRWEIMNRQLTESRNQEARERERVAQLQLANQRAQAEINTLSGQINTQIAGLSSELRVVEQRQNQAFNAALQRQREEAERQNAMLQQEMVR